MPEPIPKMLPCRHCQGTGHGKVNGAWLRAARQAAKVRQLTIAAAMGVTPGYLSQVENGDRGASEKVLAAYRAAITASRGVVPTP